MSRFAMQLLASQQGIDERLGLLRAPHMVHLVKLREQLAENAPAHIPHFDPLDGGERARCLLLLDSPGRRSAKSGSITVKPTGFVSRDDPDPTAANLRAATLQVGLPREATVLWNAVPWYVGHENKLAPTIAANWRAAMPALRQLIPLLPKLQVVVLLGRKAERAEAMLQSQFPWLIILKCPHTGGQAYNHENKRTEVLKALSTAACHLGFGSVARV